MDRSCALMLMGSGAAAGKETATSRCLPNRTTICNRLRRLAPVSLTRSSGCC